MLRPVFVLLLVVSSYSDSTFLDTLPKCSVKDVDCLKGLTGILNSYLADNGLPEFGIVKLDPMPVVNETVSIIGLVDITMVDGVAEGYKNCVLDAFEYYCLVLGLADHIRVKNVEEGVKSCVLDIVFDVNMESKITKFDMFCDVFTIKGMYNLKSSPLVEKLMGNAVFGEGTGKVIMEKLKMNFTNPFEVELRDGDVYFVPDFVNADYSYEIFERVTFEASDIRMGWLQIAPAVTLFMNRNWNYLMTAFGRLFSDRGMTLSYGLAKQFFDSVPAKMFIRDDLTPYLKL